ncbi:MAG: type I-B CRISPR-associated protein Cas8b1/Cst1, partial [bacterium]
GMNIEVVSWRGEKEIDFYTLPYEVVQLLLDRRIASSLTEIGEMSVLRMVLDRQFAKILQVGERLLTIALKPKEEWRKQDKQYINDNVHLERNKKDGAKLADFSSRLFSLYALIQEKLGGDGW